MSEPGGHPELEKLLKRIDSLERINASLMDRVERTVNDAGGAYAMFESNIVMQQTIRERTGELAEANEALRKEIDERRAAEDAMRSARDAAEAANAAKSQFLANMSHEIRTPLTAVIGFADLIREDVENTEQVKAAADTIHRNGEHLVAVINDILDLSKLESGSVARNDTPVDLARLCHDTCELLRVRSDEKAITLEIDAEGLQHPRVLTDALRLRQIVTNLVGNAIKFTLVGGVKVILSSSAEGEQVRIRLSVRDSGIGMCPEAAAKVFEPFVQADNSMSRSFGGTGLGLAISRRFAQLLEGDLAVESAEGKGSTFTLEFIAPAAEAPGESASKAKPANPSSCELDGLRVLLAEDGPDNQRLIGFHLRKLGLDVTLANDGVEAVEAVENACEPFGAIFMDMQMPRMDGYTAVRELRSSGYKGYIIALTAHAMTGDRERCLDAGCDDYETKPVSRDALKEAVLRAIRASSEKRAA